LSILAEPVFGSTLSAVCEHDKAQVPRFITEITSLIEKRGLKVDGLYRVSGNLSSIQKLRCLIDQGMLINREYNQNFRPIRRIKQGRRRSRSNWSSKAVFTGTI
jgi:hypothetical protein